MKKQDSKQDDVTANKHDQSPPDPADKQHADATNVQGGDNSNKGADDVKKLPPDSGSPDAQPDGALGLTQEDIDALGEKGFASLARRLVDIEKDLTKRRDEILRAQAPTEQRDSSSFTPAVRGTPQTDADRPDSERRDIESLRLEVSALVRDVTRIRDATRAQGVERFISSLDARMYPQFTGEHKAGASKALLDKANEIACGYRLVHDKEMDLNESLREALAIICADSVADAQRRRIADDVKRRSEQIVARGGGMSPPASRSAMQSAVGTLRQWQQQRNVKFFID